MRVVKSLLLLSGMLAHLYEKLVSGGWSEFRRWPQIQLLSHTEQKESGCP